MLFERQPRVNRPIRVLAWPSCLVDARHCELGLIRAPG
jgi:hypothetical protein